MSAVVVAALLTSPFLASSEGEAVPRLFAGTVFAGPSCPDVELVAGFGTGWRRPVILVHGVESSARRWDLPVVDRQGNESARSVIQALSAYPDIALYIFDYELRSVNWVDHPDIGQRLADAVICLSDGWRSSVDIVGHSMGGLVSRWIADQPIPNTMSTVGDRLGAVITIASPHEGSELLTITAAMIEGGISGMPAPHQILARTLLAVCGRAAAVNLHYCLIPKVRVIESAAGRALRVGSNQLDELAKWPDTVEAHQIAGDTTVTFGLFGRQLATASIGDAVTSVASATSGATNRTVFDCESRMTRVVDLMRSACVHSRLPQYSATIDSIIATLHSHPQTWVIADNAIGPVAAGMPIDRLDEITGLTWKLSSEGLGVCTVAYRDSGADIALWSVGTGSVDAIQVRPRYPSTEYHLITREGFRPGETLERFRTIYGESVAHLGTTYSNHGAIMAVDAAEDGSVDFGFVFAGPGTEGGATPRDAIATLAGVGHDLAIFLWGNPCSH